MALKFVCSRGHIRLSVAAAILMTVWRFGNMSDVALMSMSERGGQMEYSSLSFLYCAGCQI